MNIGDDLVVEAKIHARQVGDSAVTGVKQVSGNAAAGVKEFGTEFIKQMFGHGGNMPPVTDDDLAKKKEADDEFSDNAYLETRARVEAIYNEHRAKRQKEEQMRQQQEVQVKEKTMDELNEKRQMRADVAAAVGKNSAETGKSWGAE